MYSAQGIFQHHFQCKKVRIMLDKIRYFSHFWKFSWNKQIRGKWPHFKIILWCFYLMKIQLGWANFVHNFNESSRYSMKVFSVLNFSFFAKFCLISFHLWLKSFASHKYRSYLLILRVGGSCAPPGCAPVLHTNIRLALSVTTR